MKHTPGPWIAKSTVASNNNASVILWADRSRPGVHARRLDTKGEFSHPDALLLAAAPDLLEALQLLHDNLADYQRINRIGGYDNQDMVLARYAIAKAKGE